MFRHAHRRGFLAAVGCGMFHRLDAAHVFFLSADQARGVEGRFTEHWVNRAARPRASSPRCNPDAETRRHAGPLRPGDGPGACSLVLLQ